MSERRPAPHQVKLGHPISVEMKRYEEVFAPPLRPCGDHLEPQPPLQRIYEGSLSCLVIKGAFPEDELSEASARLLSPNQRWSEPNKGMKGGEIKTIGAAATPTFSSFSGPDEVRYLESARALPALNGALFDDLDPLEHLRDLFSELGGGASARPPRFMRSGEDLGAWLPFNYRALDEGEQIYTHHDQHYRLPIYEGMPSTLDRSTALSWFVTLQRPESGGELILYGLWGSDPEPPMLPTRFMDTEALEADYLRAQVPLERGDLVIFDSGRFVHRVTPVNGPRPRLTLGGFMTFSHDRSALAFWS